MSTRATVHFQQNNETVAIIYRHGDGDVIEKDLKAFFAEVKRQTPDTRFHDASYLAAKWVVHEAGKTQRTEGAPLDFLSVGVVMSDPQDIQYRYLVKCDAGAEPTVEVHDLIAGRV